MNAPSTPAPEPAVPTGATLATDGPAIRVTGLTFAYDSDSPPVLEGVTLDVRAGERLGILGPNGGGKSTLLKILLGTLRPTAGTVEILGQSPDEARRARTIGYLPQRVTAELRFPLRVMDVVLQPLLVRTRPWRKVSPDRRAWAGHCLELVGASALAEKRIGALSGGQLQRVLIARAIAAEPRVLLLDEPTVGIDVQGQKKFGEMLEVVRSELGITVVVVSHELATIAATSDRVACLRRTLHFHDAPRGLTAEVLSEVFSHDLAVLEGHAPACAHDHGGGRGGCGCADEEPGDTKGEGPSEGAGS